MQNSSKKYKKEVLQRSRIGYNRFLIKFQFKMEGSLFGATQHMIVCIFIQLCVENERTQYWWRKLIDFHFLQQPKTESIKILSGKDIVLRLPEGQSDGVLFETQLETRGREAGDGI